MENLYIEENSKYKKDNPNWHQEDSAWKANHIMNMIKRNKLELTSVVEVGCGAGEILNQMHAKLSPKIQFTGYDIASDAIQMANSKSKDRLQFVHADFEEARDHYDLMLMIDVFEHVDDYLGFLKSTREKTDYAIFHIPLDMDVLGLLRDVPMRTREAVGHLHYFTKTTAIATLTDCGYDVLDHFYTAGMIELPNKNMKSKIAAIPRKALFALNRDMAVTLLGGYSLMVLAKARK